MTDHPGRWDTRSRSAGSGETGWGSPLPAEYGSLGRYRSRSESHDGASDGSRPSRTLTASSAITRAGRSGLGRMGRALRRSTSSSEAGRRTPSWDRWKADGRISPTAASSTYRSSSAPGSVSATGLLRDLARSIAKPTPAVHQPRPRVRTEGDGAEPVPEAVPAAPRARTITHLDVYSVAKVSIVFYVILLVVFVVASILLWLVADAFGAVDSIQRSIRSLFDLKTFTLHPVSIALYVSAASAVLTVAGTIANVLAAVFYNLISEVVGGVRIGIEPIPEDDWA
jgi:hypothetical protein